MGIVNWFRDISPDAWTALAAWAAVVIGIGALFYAWRQYQRARQESEERMQPNVAMFMEPSATDWHLVELVVKNFGRTPAYGIRFKFVQPPTVGKYESAYEDRFVDIAPLNLPAEIPYLAPSQEWRIVWDSALDRRELGDSIASRFDGAVTYYAEPPKDGGKGNDRRRQLRSTAVLDWNTLHPVDRLELLTTHDLARQEKQKLELLRNLLTYFHYAASESREEVLRVEINRVRAASEELRERYRAQYNQPAANYDHAVVKQGPVIQQGPVVQQAAPPANDWSAPSINGELDDAATTTIINGRHRLL